MNLSVCREDSTTSVESVLSCAEYDDSRHISTPRILASGSTRTGTSLQTGVYSLEFFMTNIRVVILAAGKSKRMKSETPKVLVELGGKRMISHLLESVRASGVDDRPLIVVGQGADEVRRALGEGYEYVVQTEQLGTGHAVAAAEAALRGTTEAVMVLYGDHPYIMPETIRAIAEKHFERQPKITMATATIPDFEDWRKPLHDFGRVVRDAAGSIQAIVEKKDATKEQLSIREINPSYFCFDAEWLWENLKKIGDKNAQKEYYLTDLVRIAIDQGKRVLTVDVDPLETIGVNTPEHLELARKFAP